MMTVDGKVQKGVEHLVELWQCRLCDDVITNQFTKDVKPHVDKHKEIDYHQPLSKYFKVIVKARKTKI